MPTPAVIGVALQPVTVEIAPEEVRSQKAIDCSVLELVQSVPNPNTPPLVSTINRGELFAYWICMIWNQPCSVLLRRRTERIEC